MLLRKDSPTDQNHLALKIFDWALKRGQEQARALSYVPLPDEVVKQIEHHWAKEFHEAWNPASEVGLATDRVEHFANYLPEFPTRERASVRKKHDRHGQPAKAHGCTVGEAGQGQLLASGGLLHGVTTVRASGPSDRHSRLPYVAAELLQQGRGRS